MDFNQTEERQMVADALTRLLADRLPGERRRAVAYDAPWHDPELWAALVEMGVPAMLAPEARGGFGGAGFDLAAVFEPLGKALCPEPMLGHALGLAALDAAGQDMPEAVNGTHRLALAVSEPDMPYGWADMLTGADAEGRLTGRKSVVYGGHAAQSLIVAARGPDGPALYLVEATAAQVIPYGMVDGGGAAEVVLEATPGRVLTVTGGAALEAAECAGIVALSWEAVGVADWLVAATTDYLRTRKQFGRAIGQFQALQHRAVDMAVHARQIRSIAIRAAASLGTPAARRHCAMAKSLVGRAGRAIAEDAIQLHGGIGMTWEADVGHYAKRLVMIDAQLGDADWHTEHLALAL